LWRSAVPSRSPARRIIAPNVRASVDSSRAERRTSGPGVAVVRGGAVAAAVRGGAVAGTGADMCVMNWVRIANSLSKKNQADLRLGAALATHHGQSAGTKVRPLGAAVHRQKRATRLRGSTNL
jgi:hypothetical protein